jgi:hypothetical protein
VPGVSEVEARLEVHERADDHPSLQGGVPRTGPRGELFQANWSPTLRLLAGALGMCLMTNCLARRDAASVMLGTLGFGMLLRAATNTSASELMARAMPTPPAEGSRELMTAAAAGPVM